MDRYGFWFFIFAIPFICLTVYASCEVDRKCHDAGGVYVKGMLGYQCVKADRIKLGQ